MLKQMREKVGDAAHDALGWVVLGVCLVVAAVAPKQWLQRKVDAMVARQLAEEKEKGVRYE